MNKVAKVYLEVLPKSSPSVAWLLSMVSSAECSCLYNSLIFHLRGGTSRAMNEKISCFNYPFIIHCTSNKIEGLKTKKYKKQKIFYALQSLTCSWQVQVS